MPNEVLFGGPPDDRANRTKPLAYLQDALGGKISRGYLMNLSTGKRVSFLFNPEELEEVYQANYARKASLGLSHKRMQYTGSENTSIPLTLIYDQMVYDERQGPRTVDLSVDQTLVERAVDRWRIDLITMITPRSGRRLRSASPTPVLFHWPTMIDMRVRLTTLRIRHRYFLVGSARPRFLVAEVLVEEEPLERLTANMVARLGTRRPWASRGHAGRSRR